MVGRGDVVLDLVLEIQLIYMVTNTPREKAIMINVMEKVMPTAVKTSMEGTWPAEK